MAQMPFATNSAIIDRQDAAPHAQPCRLKEEGSVNEDFPSSHLPSLVSWCPGGFLLSAKVRPSPIFPSEGGIGSYRFVSGSFGLKKEIIFRDLYPDACVPARMIIRHSPSYLHRAIFVPKSLQKYSLVPGSTQILLEKNFIFSLFPVPQPSYKKTLL
jgi:hypothetical protein